MRKRVNITLSEETLALLDRITDNRSRFIEEAVRHYLSTQGARRLRERLAEGYARRAPEHLTLAQEWFPLEEETWPKGR